MGMRKVNQSLTSLKPLPGLYALGLLLNRPTTIRIGRLGSFRFKSGAYLYFGSARGPGGIAARVLRHLRDPVKKRRHWHIDWLLEVAQPQLVVWSSSSDGRECEWVDVLQSYGTREPVRFGASDCRCSGHLLRLESDSSLYHAISTLNDAVPNGLSQSFLDTQ